MGDWLGAVGDLSTAFVSVLLGGVLMLDTVPVIGMFVPADVAVLAAVATRGPLGVIAVVVAVVVGTLLGWTISFALGRFLAGPLRRSWLGRRIGDARWAGAERLVARGGGRMVLAAPFLPVFNTLVPIAAGSLRMPYRHFMGYAAVGSAMWAGSYVGLGLIAQQIGGAVFGASSDVFTTVLFGLPGLVVGWLMLASVRRRMAVGGPAEPAAPTRHTLTLPAQVVRRRRVTSAASTSQVSATASAARSSSPLVYPRPSSSMASPAAASSGAVMHTPIRLIQRRRSPGSGPMASSAIAPVASSNAATLAAACTRSPALGVSYGGSGQPGVHDTAPETAAIGAAAVRASAAARISGPFVRLLACPKRRASASRTSAAATAKMPARYTPASGAPGAPASLTYPYPVAVAMTAAASAEVPSTAQAAAAGAAPARLPQARLPHTRLPHARLPREAVTRWARSSGRRHRTGELRCSRDAYPQTRRG